MIDRQTAPVSETEAASNTRTGYAKQLYPNMGAAQQNGVILSATPLQIHIAHCLALSRRLAHDVIRKPWEDLGAAGNIRADNVGLLGELLIIDALQSANRKPTNYVLFAERAQTGPDFILDGTTRYDVKSIPVGTRYLSVNERQRVDPRHDVDFILPVYFISNSVAQILEPIPIADVGRWQLRQGHSPYRSTPISELAPLIDLRAL